MRKISSGRKELATEDRGAGRRAFVKDAAAAGLLAASGMRLAKGQAPKAAIRTRLNEVFGLEFAILLAPMGIASGGDFAAAVSNGGGLGLVGGGFGNPATLTRELELVKAKARRKWGVGLITWRAGEDALRIALGYK